MAISSSKRIAAAFALLLLFALPLRAQQQTSRGTAVEQPAQAAVTNGKYYALVIGIDTYPAPLPALKTAVSDAQAIAKVLTQRYGFQVKLLLNADATREHILDSLNQYETSLTANDNLLIYYAGHGYENKNTNKAYWLPVDATSTTSANRIIADDITTEMSALPARHILVISDSCYSGGLTRGIDDTPTSSSQPNGQQAFLRKMLSERSRNLMASGGDEPVADGGPDGHSVFAFAVLKALQENQQGMFTAADLFYGSVQRSVAGSSAQVPQFAPIRNSGDDNGDFVFTHAGLTPAEELQQLAANAPEWDRAVAAYQAKDFATAFKLIQSTCDHGQARGCSQLGYMYSNGLGTAKDFALAFKFGSQGCDGGDPNGCTNLGFIYASGNGVPKDFSKALALFRRACDGNSPMGCTNLGLMYARGVAVEHDPLQAAVFFRKACDGNDPEGCSNLGFLYRYGSGVPANLTQAVALYRKACDGGYALGCTNLGGMYQQGAGLTPDPAKAIVLYRRGCDMGEPIGCTNLGAMYATGTGVTADSTQAQALYKKACDANLARACALLKEQSGH